MELKIQLASNVQCLELFGPADRHLKMLRSDMNVEITARNGTVIISGDKREVENAAGVIDKMQKRLLKQPLTKRL